MGKRGYKARPILERFWEKVDVRAPDECWPWLGTRTDDYGVFFVKKVATNQSVSMRAGRFMLELHGAGPPPAGHWVLHHCDNPPCVNPTHLYYGPPKQNIADMDARGRRGVWHPTGERNPRAKLTDAQVRVIRSRYAAGGVSMRQLGREYGVSGTMIGDIVARRSWTHVE